MVYCLVAAPTPLNIKLAIMGFIPSESTITEKENIETLIKDYYKSRLIDDFYKYVLISAQLSR